MRGAIPPLPQYVFMVWCLVKHRDNFTFTHPLRNSKVNRVHESPPLDPILHQINPVRHFTPYLFQIRFKTILAPMLSLQSDL
jgi:hypothetical protein